MVRRLVILLVACSTIVGAYLYTRADNSERMKQEFLAIVDEIPLSDADRGHVRRWIESVHPDAFDRTFSPTRPTGSKFDAAEYLNIVWAGLISAARDEGMPDLAEQLARVKKLLRFTVTEQ